MLKLFNGGNGIFYLLWGIWGTIRPKDSAKLMGWDHNSLLGLNELRATWAAFAALGLGILWSIYRNLDQRPITAALVLATGGLFVGRAISIAIDKSGSGRTYMELGVELLVVLLGLYLLKSMRRTS
ncbi:MAG: DUF4345 family protein [Hellea sp.]|nr:DUF4345 family protein [Hellea sp.]